ncbi:hypothetical protein H0H92_014988, partial [Tricholoma furcatifolium]
MPGHNSWVPPNKLRFYESREEEFRRSVASGPVVAGRFYEKMTRLTLRRWGWDLAVEEDGPILDESTDEYAMQWDVFEGNDATEIETKQRKFEALKKRLGNWFRHCFVYMNNAKTTNGVVKDILSTMFETASIGSKNDKMTALK